MVFLVAPVIVFAKNITDFFIVESLIEGYMLIVSTDKLVTSSQFTSSYSSLTFRSDA